MFAASKIEEGVLSFEAFKQVYVSQVGSGTNFGDIVSGSRNHHHTGMACIAMDTLLRTSSTRRH
jgi:hypothetical protein